MRYTALLSIILLFLAACRNNKADQPGEGDDSLTIEENFYWQSSLNDSTGKLEMTKVPAPDSLSSHVIIDFLNNDNANIRIELVKTSNDTVYLKIADAIYLTQQMGSTGPTLYLSKVVYSFTELPGIKYVSLDFDEGDHASPGTFSRESFKDE